MPQLPGEDRYVQLLNDLEVAIFLLERQTGRLLFYNRQVCYDIRREQEELAGKTFREVFWYDFRLLLEDMLAAAEDGMPHTRIYYWAERAFWGQVQARRMQWQGADAVLVSVTNITDVSRSEYEYKMMAYYDRQLDLPNVRKLEVDVREIDSFERVGLIHFDIDRFSSISDLYGWDAGDALLIAIRDWLLGCVNRHGRLYRVGEDEFCLLLLGAGLDAVEQRADEVLERFTQPWPILAGEECHMIYCNVVMGVLYGRNLHDDMRSLMYRTMHAPKTHGRGYALYDEALDKQIKRQMVLRQQLIGSIQRGMERFSVMYQPIVDAQTDQWVGAEALCRWRTPDGAEVPPLVFVPQVEQLGMVGQMDDWVRRTSLAHCKAIGLDKKQFFLDLNLSPLQPVDGPMIEALKSVVEATGYPPQKITLEITESSRMDFSPANLRGMERLRKAGVVLSLDDFGTGYSSFENLMKLPAQVLKTEKAFIDELENDSYVRYLMKMLVDLAHTAGMKIIAEGVERPAQKELLSSFGVDYMQGYLFSPPLDAAAFADEVWRYQDDDTLK